METSPGGAYAYAYYRIAHLPGIDSFILHRQVDHPAEGGLNLGCGVALARRSRKSRSTKFSARRYAGLGAILCLCAPGNRNEIVG